VGSIADTKVASVQSTREASKERPATKIEDALWYAFQSPIEVHHRSAIRPQVLLAGATSADPSESHLGRRIRINLIPKKMTHFLAVKIVVGTSAAKRRLTVNQLGSVKVMDHSVGP
jgi:hypothetical protein